MKKEWVLITGINIVVIIGCFGLYDVVFAKKIGYVKVAELLSNYEGMKQANKQFDSELTLAKTNLDSLRNRVINLSNSNIKDKKELSYKLGKAESEFQLYQKTADLELQKRKDELTNQVILSINDYVESYGKKNNYFMILGGTSEGNLLFAREKEDLTKVILEGLNKKYEMNKAPLE